LYQCIRYQKEIKSKGENIRPTQKYNANGCSVYIRVSFKEKGKNTDHFRVTKMETKHNHPFIKKFYKIHQSNRKISESCKELTKAMLETGLKPSKVALHISKLCNRIILINDLHNAFSSSPNEDESTKLQNAINDQISHDGGSYFFHFIQNKAENVLYGVFYQNNRMRSLFKAYGTK
jgi:hypothetical protein